MTDLTPTEDLVMEVLAARYRLGETFWTFDSRHKRAILGLESKGLARLMHGIVEKSVRASLTDAGRRKYLSPAYETPLGRLSNMGICPRCREWKFIGHGPLCASCFVEATR